MGRNFDKGGKSFGERKRDKRRAKIYRTRSREDRKEIFEAMKRYQGPHKSNGSSPPVTPSTQISVEKPSLFRRILRAIGIGRGAET